MSKYRPVGSTVESQNPGLQRSNLNVLESEGVGTSRRLYLGHVSVFHLADAGGGGLGVQLEELDGARHGHARVQVREADLDQLLDVE
jgi:hypothetical protein